MTCLAVGASSDVPQDIVKTVKERFSQLRKGFREKFKDFIMATKYSTASHQNTSQYRCWNYLSKAGWQV
jgi:hypothetical protein